MRVKEAAREWGIREGGAISELATRQSGNCVDCGLPATLGLESPAFG